MGKFKNLSDFSINTLNWVKKCEILLFKHHLKIQCWILWLCNGNGIRKQEVTLSKSPLIAKRLMCQQTNVFLLFYLKHRLKNIFFLIILICKKNSWLKNIFEYMSFLMKEFLNCFPIYSLLELLVGHLPLLYLVKYLSLFNSL